MNNWLYVRFSDGTTREFSIVLGCKLKDAIQMIEKSYGKEVQKASYNKREVFN